MNDFDKNTVQASPYGHTTDVTSSDNPFIIKKQPKQCRDPLFAVLLYANVAAIIAVFFKYGLPALNDVMNAEDAQADETVDEDAIDIDAAAIVKVAIGTAAVATVLSGVTMQILMCIPGILIKAAVIFNVIVSLMVAVYGFMSGSMIIGIIGLIFFALMLCYAKIIWSRIPFATANLKTGCTAVRANCGVTLFAYIFTALSIGWVVMWSLAVAGIKDTALNCVADENGNEACKPSYGILFVLFVSYFFTNQVLMNCVHVTVAGVVGSWWFNPKQSGFCGSAVCGSFVRTMTTSFGSICFGSLLVAIIQAVRQLTEMARQNDEIGNALACCIDCILGILESLLEYFNKWSFVYVGLYGFGYCEAGKNVMSLFKDRGWEAIIADDLVGMVLFMMSLIVGLITGGIGVIFVTATDWFANTADENLAKIIAFIIGLIVGMVICSILMGVISSSVNTTIVCFADGPAEFEENHPELSAEMRRTYQEAYPGY